MKLIAVLLAITGFAFASVTFSGHGGGPGGGAVYPETDDLLDSYAYSQAEQMSTVASSFGETAAIDDFTYAGDADVTITGYVVWGVTTTSVPSALNLLVVEDDGGLPTGAPTFTSYPINTGNTGYTYGGYTIWMVEFDLSDNPEVVIPVWLGHHREGADSWYPLGGTTVTGSEGYRTTEAGWNWIPFSGGPEPLPSGDLFKVIEGTVSLQRNTWASIKNMF